MFTSESRRALPKNSWRRERGRRWFDDAIESVEIGMVWRLGEILKSTNVIDAHNPVHGILTEYVRMGAG